MPNSVSEELSRLLDLRERGGLTPEEFDAQKRLLLSHDSQGGSLKLRPQPPRIVRIFLGVLLGAIALCALLLLFAAVSPSPEVTSSPPVQTAADRQAAADQARAEAERKRTGEFCLSMWSGAEPQFVDAVKEQLRDPDSFEHITTKIEPADIMGLHSIQMRFRSHNGFGGMTEATAHGRVDGATCDAVVENVKPD